MIMGMSWIEFIDHPQPFCYNENIENWQHRVPVWARTPRSVSGCGTWIAP